MRKEIHPMPTRSTAAGSAYRQSNMPISLGILLIVLLFCMAPTAALGEVCQSSNTEILLLPFGSNFDTLQPTPLGPSTPWYATVEFDVSVTLKKFIPDDRHPCVFTTGSWIWISFKVTNLSDEPYWTYFGVTGKFWDLYIYEPRRTNLVTRFSQGASYTDDRILIDLLPGESMTETRLWMFGNYWDLIPAGSYEAYGRLEPDNAWLLPQFGRDDTTISPRLQIIFVDE
jgi:hypothetical protein